MSKTTEAAKKEHTPAVVGGRYVKKLPDGTDSGVEAIMVGKESGISGKVMMFCGQAQGWNTLIANSAQLDEWRLKDAPTAEGAIGDLSALISDLGKKLEAAEARIDELEPLVDGLTRTSTEDHSGLSSRIEELSAVVEQLVAKSLPNTTSSSKARGQSKGS